MAEDTSRTDITVHGLPEMVKVTEFHAFVSLSLQASSTNVRFFIDGAADIQLASMQLRDAAERLMAAAQNYD